MKMGMLMDKIDFTSEMFFLFMGFHHEMDDFLMFVSASYGDDGAGMLMGININNPVMLINNMNIPNIPVNKIHMV